MPTLSPMLASRASAPARLIQIVPGAGMPPATDSGPPALSSTMKSPRSGKPSAMALRSPRRSDSPTRTMLGKDQVSVLVSPGAAASVRSGSSIGESARTTTSPPSRRLASWARARSARSVMKPTAHTAVTASTRAASRMRTSPEARSRRSWRRASPGEITPPPAGPTRAAAGGRSARPGLRRGSPAPGWCPTRGSCGTEVR